MRQHVQVLLKRVIQLAFPSILTFSSMTLTGMLTLVIVGRLGAAAIAIVGITNIFMYNIWALFAGLNESVNFLVSQNYGEGTMDEGNRRTQIALVVTLLIDLGWLFACLFLPHAILVMMGANSSVADSGIAYMRMRMLAFLCTMFTNVFFAYMRAVGDTRAPMVISIVVNGLLVLLTYVLTYGVLGIKGYGLLGAGWSAVITEVLGLVMSLIVFYGRPYAMRYATRVWHALDWSSVRLIAHESTKLSVMEVSMSLGMLLFTMAVARLGTNALAANEIALNILSLGFMPANGFAAAATIIVGQDIGAGRPNDAKQGGFYTAIMGLIFMGLFSIFLWLFALPVARIYTNDPAVYLISISLIHIAALVQLFDGANMVFAGALRGVGDTTYLYRVSIVSNWVVFIPLMILLIAMFHLGQAGAWISLCTMLILLGVANSWRYIKLDWGSVAMLRSRPMMDAGDHA